MDEPRRWRRSLVRLAMFHGALAVLLLALGWWQPAVDPASEPDPTVATATAMTADPAIQAESFAIDLWRPWVDPPPVVPGDADKPVVLVSVLRRQGVSLAMLRLESGALATLAVNATAEGCRVVAITGRRVTIERHGRTEQLELGK